MTTIESSPEAVAVAPSDADADTSSLLEGIAGIFTSTDHKVTGRLYLAGGLLGLVATVVINVLLGVERLDGGDTVLGSEILPQLVDGQLVGLVFATLLPLVMAACVMAVPLQLGARSIAFPRLASSGFWMWFSGAVLTTVALLDNGGTLGGNADAVALFIAGLGLMAVGITATAGAVATTVFTTRAPGMTMRRVPPFSWSALVFALGIVLVMPVLLGTLAYLFVDHRNARTGFGGNEGVLVWAGWALSQPVTFLFAIPAIGVLAELVPVVFGRRMPMRGVMFGGLAVVGMAALAGVTQQNIQNLPWAGSQLNVDDLETKVRDLVPFLLFNALPILGMLGNLLYAADDLALQGTVFNEATLVYIVYGAVLATMGAVIHWAPKMWGSTVASAKAAPVALLGLTGTILAAFPMYIAGFLDQPAGTAYLDDDLVLWNIISLVGHALFAVAVLGFIGLVLLSVRSDRSVGDDPWDAQTLEWTTTSPAPRDNFAEIAVVHSAEPLLDLKSASNDGSNA